MLHIRKSEAAQMLYPPSWAGKRTKVFKLPFSERQRNTAPVPSVSEATLSQGPRQRSGPEVSDSVLGAPQDRKPLRAQMSPVGPEPQCIRNSGQSLCGRRAQSEQPSCLRFLFA